MKEISRRENNKNGLISFDNSIVDENLKKQPVVKQTKVKDKK
jgi:hypothetical protein